MFWSYRTICRMGPKDYLRKLDIMTACKMILLARLALVICHHRYMLEWEAALWAVRACLNEWMLCMMMQGMMNHIYSQPFTQYTQPFNQQPRQQQTQHPRMQYNSWLHLAGFSACIWFIVIRCWGSKQPWCSDGFTVLPPFSGFTRCWSLDRCHIQNLDTVVAAVICTARVHVPCWCENCSNPWAYRSSSV